jgi:hypothetical protein
VRFVGQVFKHLKVLPYEAAAHACQGRDGLRRMVAGQETDTLEAGNVTVDVLLGMTVGTAASPGMGGRSSPWRRLSAL